MPPLKISDSALKAFEDISEYVDSYYFDQDQSNKHLKEPIQRAINKEIKKLKQARRTIVEKVTVDNMLFRQLVTGLAIAVLRNQHICEECKRDNSEYCKTCGVGEMLGLARAALEKVQS